MTQTGETNLPKLLQTMQPIAGQEDVVFCCVAEVTEAIRNSALIALIQEAEGTTVILAASAADALGLTYNGRFRQITLTVHSSLEAVGLTAAVSTALAKANISANVVAAFYHDHIFVPADKLDAAMQALLDLTQQVAS